MNENQSYTAKILDVNWINSFLPIQLILITLLLPWFNIFVVGNSLIRNFWGVFKAIANSFVPFLIALMVYIGIAYLVLDAYMKYEYFEWVVSFGIGGGGLLCFFWFLQLAYLELQILRRDIKQLNEIKKEKTWTREIIAQEFDSLKTDYYRKKYVIFLDFSRADPKGRWPEDRLPNINNDKSSTYLAQLEERWRGLSGV